jgi:CheY-like chemotaxis protein
LLTKVRWRVTLGLICQQLLTWSKDMPLTILIAEDDEGTRLSLRDYLELEGYSVLTASHGEGALQQVFSHQPQLIITDVGMPGLDGYSLVQKVRQLPAFRRAAGDLSNRSQPNPRSYQGLSAGMRSIPSEAL